MSLDAPDPLDLLHEAAVIPELWPRAIEGLGALVQAQGGALVTLTAGSMRYATTPSYGPSFARYVASGDDRLNVRPPRAMARQRHGFLRDLDLCTTEELARDPIYDRYLRPIGIGWTVGTLIPVPGGDLLAFEIGRSPDLGPFTPREVSRLDRMRPHLARAAHLAGRLGLAQARSAAAALAAVGLPAAVLRARGQVVAANPLFEALAPRISTSGRDQLRLGHPMAQRLLDEALNGATRERPAGVRSIPLPAGEEAPPLILHLTPIRRAAQDLFGTAQWIAVVTPVVAGQSSPDPGLLQGLFDLTAAEARVTRGLLEGASAAQIAAATGVSITTLRSQIRAVLAKTGTTRQVDLVQMLTGAMLPGPGQEGSGQI